MNGGFWKPTAIEIPPGERLGNYFSFALESAICQNSELFPKRLSAPSELRRDEASLSTVERLIEKIEAISDLVFPSAIQIKIANSRSERASKHFFRSLKFKDSSRRGRGYFRFKVIR